MSLNTIPIGLYDADRITRALGLSLRRFSVASSERHVRADALANPLFSGSLSIPPPPPSSPYIQSSRFKECAFQWIRRMGHKASKMGERTLFWESKKYLNNFATCIRDATNFRLLLYESARRLRKSTFRSLACCVFSHFILLPPSNYHFTTVIFPVRSKEIICLRFVHKTITCRRSTIINQPLDGAHRVCG